MSRPLALVADEGIRDGIRALHPTTRRKVWAAIDALRADPHEGRELRDELSGLWRFPVGELRVVYRFKARTLEIAAIGRRATIYEDLARRLRR